MGRLGAGAKITRGERSWARSAGLEQEEEAQVRWWEATALFFLFFTSKKERKEIHRGNGEV